jgi:hypothetical protein
MAFKDNKIVGLLHRPETGELLSLDNLTESLERIIYFYHNKLTQNVIVPQDMGYGPVIRHSPLYFGLGNNKKSIIVKYTTFGNFNIAFSLLKKLY